MEVTGILPGQKGKGPEHSAEGDGQRTTGRKSVAQAGAQKCQGSWSEGPIQEDYPESLPSKHCREGGG